MDVTADCTGHHATGAATATRTTDTDADTDTARRTGTDYAGYVITTIPAATADRLDNCAQRIMVCCGDGSVEGCIDNTALTAIAAGSPDTDTDSNTHRSNRCRRADRKSTTTAAAADTLRLESGRKLPRGVDRAARKHVHDTASTAAAAGTTYGY